MKTKMNLITIVIALLMMSISVLALPDGVYVASNNASYTNPDTGEIDDGGTSNAALGQGMSRSAIGSTSLIEVEDGKTYVTIRLQLVSNFRNIRFNVQQTIGDPNSYKQVSTEIMTENGVNDTRDYRFEVPSASSHIAVTGFVTPMGRDVDFFVQINENTATQGSEDFVVSISLEEIEQEVEEVITDEEEVEESPNEDQDETKEIEPDEEEIIEEEQEESDETIDDKQEELDEAIEDGEVLEETINENEQEVVQSEKELETSEQDNDESEAVEVQGDTEEFEQENESVETINKVNEEEDVEENIEPLSKTSIPSVLVLGIVAVVVGVGVGIFWVIKNKKGL